MTDIQNIPLNMLTVWKGNVRKTQNKAGIEELAASIKAHGLQQNLVVKKDGKRFAVVAGKRRLSALQLLVKAGDIPATHKVPCRIADANDASEISLAENIMREDMHPADQFEAFRTLADKGMPATDIAVRFGKTEAHVLRILKLARVSPKVLKAYRDENLALEDVMAFGITDDHDAQERVLKEMAPWQGAREIRAALTESVVPATDKRVKFLTLEAYENAGGKTTRDLFAEDDNGIYLEEAALLDALVVERLEQEAKAVRAEGWKWVEVCIDFGYERSAQIKRIHAEPLPLTDAEEKRLAVLRDGHDKLSAAFDDSGDDEPPTRLDELEELIAEIEDRDGVWTQDQLASAGAAVTIGYQGKLVIERGLVRPEDMPKQNAKGKTAEQSVGGGKTVADQERGLPAPLVESLTAHRSAAIAASLLDAPEKALSVAVYALALDTFGHADEAVAALSAKPQSLHRVEGSQAFQRIKDARASWGERIPGTRDDLWKWCLGQDQAVLLDLLAFCTASTINAVQLKSDRPDSSRLVHAGQLAHAVALEMRAWFTPTAENYFSRVSKQHIFQALVEARGTPPAPAWEQLKKPELAARAEREIAPTGWLPKVLRQPL
jgi:ParB family chromosome partitioning protein